MLPGAGGGGILAAVRNQYLTGRYGLHCQTLGVLGVLERLHRIQVFAGGDIAQGEGLPHHLDRRGVDGVDTLNVGVAQPALEQGCMQGGGGYLQQQLSGVRVQRLAYDSFIHSGLVIVSVGTRIHYRLVSITNQTTFYKLLSNSFRACRLPMSAMAVPETEG